MSPQAIVAIILATGIAILLVTGSDPIRGLVGFDSLVDHPEATKALENIMFAIVGALAGYLGGKKD